MSHITYCEIRYHIPRENTGGFFHFCEFLQETIELESVSSKGTWRKASDFKNEYTLALGDAFSLAAAVTTNSTLIVGADDDFEGLRGVDIEQIRTVAD